MGIFDTVKAANTVLSLTELISNASRVLSDPTSTPEEKKDASRAKRLGDKKIAEKDKPKMYNGGMAHGKKHMYLGGNASVKDNAGLRALKKSSPEAYMNIVKNVK